MDPIVHELTAMGFEREVAVAAVENVGADLEAAVAWIIEFGQTGQAPAEPSSTISSPPAATAPYFSEQLRQFSAQFARERGGGEVKMVILVRRDLEMSVGKVAAQAIHAALGASREAEALNPAQVIAWLEGGEKVVTLGVADLDEMKSLVAKAKEASVVTHVVRDAGRTEVAPSTETVAAVGPALASEIDKITGHLRLL